MGAIKINATTNYREPVIIGRARENKVTRIDFDLSGWIAAFGAGTVALSVQRQIDAVPYPVAIAIGQGGVASWEITDTETVKTGHIKAQLTYYVGTKRKKSNIYVLSVRESLAENGQAPDPYESWLEVLQELTAETAANAESARQSAASAGQSASDAEQSMQEAQGYADDASTSAQNAENSAQSAENSADEAEHYADLAAQHAESAGYVIFDVDEQTGEAIATVTDAVDEAMTFAVDEANGDLEVTLI